MVAGLFVVFEGPDGSGKGTVIAAVEKAIRDWNKHQNITLTREPTHKAKELAKMLKSESDPMASARKMTQLFVEDRKQHYHEEIKPDLVKKRVVLCDRYSISTLVYQSVQGLPINELVAAHVDANIGAPDIIFYLALEPEEALRRIAKRGQQIEKFEQPEFIKKVVQQHELVYAQALEEGSPISKLLGRVVKINANLSPDEVAKAILDVLEPIYRQRAENRV